MVKINNQRKAFLDMPWSGGTDNGRQTEIMVMTSLWAESYLLITPVTLINLSLNPNSNQQAPDATGFFPLVGCLPQAAWPEGFSRKVRTLWHCSKLKADGALLPDWSWWYPSGNRPLQQYLGFTAGRWVMVGSSIKAVAWLLNSKSGRNGQRLMYEQVTAIISHSGYLHHRLPVMGC